MTPRLRARVLVSALIRLAEGEGGTGAVLARGDPDAGAVLVWLAERGRLHRLLGRERAGDGSAWTPVGPQDVGDASAVQAYLERRRATDSDLWLVELDVADAERLAARLADAG